MFKNFNTENKQNVPFIEFLKLCNKWNIMFKNFNTENKQNVPFIEIFETL